MPSGGMSSLKKQGSMDQSLGLPLPIKGLSGQHLVLAVDFWVSVRNLGWNSFLKQEADGCETGRNFIFFRKLQRWLLM